MNAQELRVQAAGFGRQAVAYSARQGNFYLGETVKAARLAAADLTVAQARFLRYGAAFLVRPSRRRAGGRV